MSEHQGFSLNYRISDGPQKGRKVFSLKTLPPVIDAERRGVLLGKVGGFSLHAGVAAKADEREKLERLCRYITRPLISTHRLSLTAEGNVQYELKTPYRDGTTHVIFEPLDFISKLAALIPAPRVNLIRYHDIFAPNSNYRSGIIGREQNLDPSKSADSEGRVKSKKRAAMTWAQCLKRAFKIDVEVCECNQFWIIKIWLLGLQLKIYGLG